MLTKKIAKYIQSLSHKKFRDEFRSFIAEGPKVVEELLMEKKFSVEWLIGTKDWFALNPSLTDNVPPSNRIEVLPFQLESISQLKTPNEVLAVFKQPETDKLPAASGRISLMLDDLRDPGNLGTIIRIADWFGIPQIICSMETVDCFNSKVVQSTMGSLARVQIVYTDLADYIQANQSVPLFGAVLNGQSIYEMPPLKEGIIIIGNESHGIQAPLLDRLTHKITIPKKGNAESLNAAVATAIIISHLT